MALATVAERADDQEEDPKDFGGWVPKIVPTPFSDAMERVERQVSGVFDQEGKPAFTLLETNESREAFERDVKLGVERKEEREYRGPENTTLTASLSSRAAQVSEGQAQVIPADLLAVYRMCEFIYHSEGDVKQAIDVPMDLSVRPIQVEDQDPDVQGVFEDLYGADYLDLDSLMPDVWLSRDLYGAAYILELWDKQLPSPDKIRLMMRGELPPIVARPQQLSLLHPRSVYVGRQPFTGNTFSFSPSDPEGVAFRRQLAELAEPPMTYNSLSYDMHEHLVYAWNVPLNPSCVTQIRDKSNSFTRYPWPRLMSVFRTITTRQVLEEMVRATIEGSKNQLWYFGLGPKDGGAQPSDAEMNALRAAVSGTAGERTGSFVWRGWLRIEVHSPNVEPAMVEMKWRQLTDHALHQMGISRQIISGADARMVAVTEEDIDVKVLIERMVFRRNQLNSWLTSFTKKICLFSGDPDLIRRVVRKDRKGPGVPVTRMADFGIETESTIKNKILPLYQAGLISPQTALKRAGMNYDHELANHKSADKEALMPPASFAQAVVKDGETTTTVQGPAGQTKRPKSANAK